MNKNKTADNFDNLDDLVNWIQDDSKVLTKKQKKALNKKDTINSNNNKLPIDSNKKELKKKLKKFNRTEQPFYGKSLDERIQLQKQYKKMIEEEKIFKDNKIKEIYNRMNTITNDNDKEEYLKTLIENNEIMMK